MTLSLDQLNAFSAVARHKSFTKAAHELSLTQSALSHRIKNLERSLEKTLFVRDASGARLTEAGFRLLDFCRVQTQIESELLNDFQENKDSSLGGFLRIGGASSVLWSVVAPALSNFICEHANIQIEMMERELNELPKLLNRGAVDFIVMCGKLESANIEGIYLGDETNVLVEPKKRPFRGNVFLDHDTNDETTINYLRHQGIRSPNITRSFMDNIQGIISGVEAGFGKAVLPKHLIKENRNVSIIKGQKELRTPIYLYYLRQPFYSRLHTAVVRTLEDNSVVFLEI